MCLVVFARGTRPDLPLLVSANRDEFLKRPTA
ncbi:MAG TPA: NRDE family protein, partial [Thermoanaerobaculia bacterium]|nr:NRDE family protein [Thermoanaerobaculia bacterium]